MDLKKVLLFWQNCCETFSVCCETFPTCWEIFPVCCETFLVCCETFPVSCETFPVCLETFLVCCQTFLVCCETFPKNPLAVKWESTIVTNRRTTEFFIQIDFEKMFRMQNFRDLYFLFIIALYCFLQNRNFWENESGWATYAKRK